MGTGQMMLTLGALVLLSTLAISVNRTLVTNDDEMRQAARQLQAVSLAQNLIEEGLTMVYDERPTAMSTFTMPESTSVGPELGETYESGFDDIDDYNGLDRTITINGDEYRMRLRVGYVDPGVAAHMAAPEQGPWVAWGTAYASTRTYYKKMEVRVRCTSTPVEVCLNHLFAFRP